MSKYITTRLEKINILSNELKNVCEKIDSYIIILKNIQKEHGKFSIHYAKKNLDFNTSIFYYKNIILSYNYLLETHHFSFFKFEKLLLDYTSKSLINKQINLETFREELILSFNLYHKIEKLYKEVNLKNSGFTNNSNIIVSHFKKLTKEQDIEIDSQYKYLYVKLRKDNSLEAIDVILKNTPDNSSFKIKLPIVEEIEKIYIENNSTNTYDKELYIDIFKKEFVRLNKYFFDNFNIDETGIDFYFSSNFSTFCSDYYNFNLSCDLYINYLDKDHIKCLVNKIEINNQISNF